EQTAIELEAETARLREFENRQETLRVEHYAASDTVHTAQGSLYEANAETARLEQVLQHQRDSRRRVENQMASISRESDETGRLHNELQVGLVEQRSALQQATEQLEECREQERHEAQQLPTAEQAYAATRADSERLGQDLAR